MISTLAALLIATAPVQDAPAQNLAVVREALDTRLNDYPSARFRRVRITQDGSLICGQVNARGTQGGYDGWKTVVIDAADEAAPNVRIAQADGVAQEFEARCSARTDWRPEDYSSDIDFED